MDDSVEEAVEVAVQVTIDEATAAGLVVMARNLRRQADRLDSYASLLRRERKETEQEH